MDATLTHAVRSAAARFRAGAAALNSSSAAGALLDQLVARLAATGLVGRANELPSSVLWSELSDLLCWGWLQLRAREKPRGYAGDFELLAAVHEHRLCEHPLGRHFDLFFQSQAAPRAVRNRMHLVRGWTRDLPAGRLVSIGCGSALDVAAGLRDRSQPSSAQPSLTVSLLDLDPAAIEAAAQNVSKQVAGDSEFHACNLARLPARSASHSWLANARLLVCTGLFDYLDDSAATDCLRLFWNSLAPGGTLHVFNFAPWNPTRTYMEWIGAWYLNYRTPSQMRSLAAAAGIPAACRTLQAEPCGIDLYLSATRPPA